MSSKSALAEVKEMGKKIVPAPIRRFFWRAKEFILDHTEFTEKLLGIWKEALFQAEFVRNPSLRTFLLRTIRFSGDLVLVLRDFPMTKAYSLEGQTTRVVFVGREVEEFTHLFFSGDLVKREEPISVWSWQLPKKTKEWLAGGVDMVVHGVSRFFPWRAKAAFQATTPKWISQYFPIPDNCDEPPAGPKMRTLRKIYRDHAGCIGFRYSEQVSDFDVFYHRMYRPYVSNRHGSFVYVEPYEYLYKWFKKGGLILVNCKDELVSAMLVVKNGKWVYAAEAGVMDGNPELHAAGFPRVSVWSTAQWGNSQGCRKFQMGGTYSFRSNGVFQYKTFWNTIVTDFYGFIRNQWQFYLEQPGPALLNDLNEWGIIHEHRHQFYGVVFEGAQEPDAVEIARNLKTAHQDGLAGILRVSPGKMEYLC
ncbi:hypothetical protein ADN00_08950 [Ornatilinea apprima]|uniref:BioF2-like acetyltransferase domain-containing protein n=2 Tax=Ornatilinea apprima TaxID=1134406 RepID=A0A0P6XPS3_9CHLR|nr:hypothetical protein ADN00_08950 [Ornatilinea apprima]